MQQIKIHSVYACGVSGDEKKTYGPAKSGSGGCMVLLLLLAFAVAMPVTASTVAAEPAPRAAPGLSASPESPESTDVNINHSPEKCLSHCEDILIKRLLSRVPSGRCLVHVILHTMVRNDSIVAANISWGTVGRKELAWSPTLEPCPEQELTPAGLGSQCLVWWEESTGGVTGHLVTESSSVQLSLWPNTIYRVQVSCRSKRTEILVRSPILKLNTSTAAETVAAAVTWQPPPESEFFDANEDGSWPYRNPNYTTKPEEPEEPEVKAVPTDNHPELNLFVGLVIFLFVMLLSMALAAANPDNDRDRDGTNPEHHSMMMGNDEPMVEIQHV